MQVAGIAVAGVGVVGLVVFAVAGASSNAKYNEVKANCMGACTNPKYIDDISSGKTLDAVANVGLGIGIAGLVGGGALFLLGGRRSESATLELGPRSVRVEGTF